MVPCGVFLRLCVLALPHFRVQCARVTAETRRKKVSLKVAVQFNSILKMFVLFFVYVFILNHFL